MSLWIADERTELRIASCDFFKPLVITLPRSAGSRYCWLTGNSVWGYRWSTCPDLFCWSSGVTHSDKVGSFLVELVQFLCSSGSMTRFLQFVFAGVVIMNRQRRLAHFVVLEMYLFRSSSTSGLFGCWGRLDSSGYHGFRVRCGLLLNSLPPEARQISLM